MKKHYSPQEIEASWLDTWQSLEIGKPRGDGDSYCIMLPPPNVTGTLHKGHGFQQSIMDALIRFHRMCGHKTLWQPGTDHAGIATQMVVERQLARDGVSRHDIGREAFIDKVWEWKGKSGNTISQQMRRLGVSPDWSREKFTLDDDMNHAVQEAFIRLHRDGLIYRGQRLVNWDPVFETAISDLEVINETRAGHLWHLRYPVVDSDTVIIVATSRPETMFGDTAVAVHPEDERYQHLIGKQVRLPLSGRLIPIIADEHVSMEFGTGCVKITPAHDFNDYAMAQRHDLPMINILTPDAHLNDNTPEAFRGMERFAARKATVEAMEVEEAIERIEDYEITLPIGDRSKAVIEPMLTDQWFVRMEPLAKPALEAVENGRVRFIPDNWRNTYNQWLTNIEDWCISRQLWWGHRIPAWYDADGNCYVGHDETDVRQQYGLTDDVALRQDDDVLDTWFSSALWPFSTLGWPESTAELKDFFPTSCLVTGFDIIFFWVARMIMMSIYFMGDIPFEDVYITGLVRDQQGQKMSKSKGNIIDPVDLIDGISLDDLIAKRTHGMMQPEKAAAITKATRRDYPDGIPAHGTDALRFTYCALASNGRDINFDMERLAGYRNFCNKLWNASRFVLQSTPEKVNPIEVNQLKNPINRWLSAKLEDTIALCRQHVSQYRFDLFCQEVHRFVWEDYCDWFLELSKLSLKHEEEGEANETQFMLLHALDQICRLMHPVTPFLTEEIWRHVKPRLGHPEPCLALAAYPEAGQHQESPVGTDLESVAWLQNVVGSIRRIRSQMCISPQRQIDVILTSSSQKEDQASWSSLATWIHGLAKLESIIWKQEGDEFPPAAAAVVDNLVIRIPLEGLIDPQAEHARLEKQMQKLEKEAFQLSKRLDNPKFVDSAPAEVVAQCRSRVQAITEELAQLAPQRDEIAKLL